MPSNQKWRTLVKLRESLSTHDPTPASPLDKLQNSKLKCKKTKRSTIWNSKAKINFRSAENSYFSLLIAPEKQHRLKKVTVLHSIPQSKDVRIRIVNSITSAQPVKKVTHNTDVIHSSSVDKEVSQTPQTANKHKTNSQQPQNKLPTPINSDVLNKYLSKYEQAIYIIKGLREGFMLKFDGREMAVKPITKFILIISICLLLMTK